MKKPFFLFLMFALLVLSLKLSTTYAADDSPNAGCNGAGAGMMGGQGMGPGMMGEAGSGMMGGQGVGAGMMAPGMMPGIGSGMMMGGNSLAMLARLDLTPDQRDKITAIQQEQRKQHWNTARKMFDEQIQLNELYSADTLDSKKIGAAYGRVAKLQQDEIEANVNTWNRVQGLLTKDQRDQLKQWRNGFGGPGGQGNAPAGMGPGMMRR